MNFKTILIRLLIMCLAYLPSALAFQEENVKKRGRYEFAFLTNANTAYGFTDKYDVHFDVPASDIKLASFGGSLGIEGVNADHFGFRLLSGYQRVFYSDIGFQQIEKNYLTVDLLFEYFFIKDVFKIDPYVFAGPHVLASESGVQGYLMVGVGARRFINDIWSLHVDPAITTDFSGVGFQLSAGVTYHLKFRSHQTE